MREGVCGKWGTSRFHEVRRSSTPPLRKSLSSRQLPNPKPAAPQPEQINTAVWLTYFGKGRCGITTTYLGL